MEDVVEAAIPEVVEDVEGLDGLQIEQPGEDDIMIKNGFEDK